MTQKELTGYPSIDRPWLKYHNPNVYETPMPQKTAYEYLWENNKEHLENVALEYYGRKVTYKELFANIERTASSFSAIGVKEGDMIAMNCFPSRGQ